MPKKAENKLFYGDNLAILKEYIEDESIDLIYLDPPFNSKRSYNVLFSDESGEESEAQIEAFDDTWHWDTVAIESYHGIVHDSPPRVSSMIGAMKEFIGTNQMMAYLVMMTIRLVELSRVLKPTGSIYLHCDPTASHYLKIIMDTIFGVENFKNEIIWRRTGSHNKVKRYAPIHDTILFYTKSKAFEWTYPTKPYMKGHVENYFVKDNKGYKTNYYGNVLTGSGTRGGESGKTWKGFNPTEKGRHWAIPKRLKDEVNEDMSNLSQHEKLDLLYDRGFIKIEEGATWPIYEHYIKPDDGTSISDIWAYQPYTQGTVFMTSDGIDEDVRWLSTKDQERLGYPTQKPIGILERIIESSSNEGDVILDPFCGCGTAIAASEKLNRKWMGIDITHLSIALQKYRLKDSFDVEAGKDYEVIGEPTTVGSAKQLAEHDRYQFQWWALSLVKAKPLGEKVGTKKGKKGKDRGIDGVINFIENTNGKANKVLVQIKSGKVSSQLIRDLRGTVEREKAAIGVFITLEEPTKDMITEALEADYYKSKSWNEKYRRIQILTIEDIFENKKIDMPPDFGTFKSAQKHSNNKLKQGDLEL